MSRSPHLLVVGDVVLDRDLDGSATRLAPDAPVPVVDVEREWVGPGGAGLTALLCLEEGARVTLVAPWTDDPAGRRWRRALEVAGAEVVPLGAVGTTREKTRVLADGQVVVRYDSGGPAHPLPGLPDAVEDLVERADVALVACYGRGTSDHEQLRPLLARRARHRPIVWDPHPAGPPPVPGVTLATPNLAEARRASEATQGATGDELAGRLVRAWDAAGVAVTDGAHGAWFATGSGEPLHVPAEPAEGDPCGAGDRFAAAAAVALGRGRTPGEAVTGAVAAATRFVGDGGASGYRRRAGARDDAPATAESAAAAHAAAPGPSRPAASRSTGDSVTEVVARVRATGGTLVAAGGCFDGLHAGHVQYLQAARGLGEGLVVLLNSDASVRRLKGPKRPVHSQQDRVRVLRGLACVDAVVVFDEDGPETILRTLRPDVWAKGGDYEGTELPEAPLVRGWGGRVVLLPYLSGRSTTALLQRLR
ncbi:PfkB family carbohydrate kinase [Phycicoccus sp. 3266]|uniref:PfkB family carbohydrate kinase n=1 Tax=Phycicoccus sp. 3266 TaxID=2817751 RepID=UPI0028678058|nr:PfkB family carbohydrate kinase [Phycicoccus sp. 3266]MDR6864739.1 rfaE bifunctional protein nucleotidyltransferase chain/domain/rfaE bifunctional protein kinase chain/domain [Phycicoccus sp. 3266]